MPFDSEATVEFVVPERLPPPVCETNDIAVPAPQEVAHPQPNSLIRLLPIVTAVATVGVMAAAYYARSMVARNPSLLMFPVVMLMSAVATVLSGSDRRRGEINLRRADYLDDLSTVRAAAVEAIAAQHESVLWHHPEPDTLWTLVGGRRMWGRRAVDPDFCQVRIGVGTAPLSRQLVAPTIDSLNRVDPVCTDALHRLLDTYSTVSNAPIVIALRGPAVVNVRGGAGQVRALLRAMVCQLAVLHSPATVLIAAVVTDRNRHDWDWLKWLPHNRHPDACDDLGAARMLYASLAAAREALDDVMSSDDPTVPHLVVVVDDESEDPTWAAEGVTSLIVEHRDHEPVVVTVSGEDVAAHPDQLSYAAALLCAQ
ncbi:MAG: segregation ATPase FtsK/SpoIIIE, family, partial [Mycobacterium sp.]|nr:segregation ATPase FtsK/SpoIIIE, family [Mycobacterium sp.]